MAMEKHNQPQPGEHAWDHPSVDHPSMEPHRNRRMGDDPSPVKTRLATTLPAPWAPKTVAEHNAWVDKTSAEQLKD
jgi:hypothetical protein